MFAFIKKNLAHIDVSFNNFDHLLECFAMGRQWTHSKFDSQKYLNQRREALKQNNDLLFEQAVFAQM